MKKILFILLMLSMSQLESHAFQTPCTTDGGMVSLATGDDNVCSGHNPSAFTSSSAATFVGGCIAPQGTQIEYLWQQKTDTGNWSSAPGTNDNATYDPGVVNETMHYRRKATYGTNTDYSNTLTITIAALDAGTISGPQGVQCYNSSYTLTGTAATGGDNDPDYEWQSQPKDTQAPQLWMPLSDTTQNITTGNLTQSTRFRRTATICGQSVYTDYVIDIHAAVVAGDIDVADNTVCHNTTAPTLTSSAAASGGSGSLTYTWWKKVGTGSWQEVTSSDPTNLTYSPGILTETASFKRRATDSCNEWDDTDEVIITVHPQLNGGTISNLNPTVFCYNQPLSPMQANPSGGDDTYSYVWEQNTGTGWQPALGTSADARVFTPNAHITDVQFRVTISSCTQDVTVYTDQMQVGTEIQEVAFASTQQVEYCSDEQAKVELASSQSGVYYQLYKNDVAILSPILGDGQPISWNISETAEYKVGGYVTGCQVEMMPNSLLITMTPLPVEFDVTGGGNVCWDNGGSISLSGSENQRDYYLTLDGIIDPYSRQTGNGSALAWTGLSNEGQYGVVTYGGTCGTDAYVAMRNLSTPINILAQVTAPVSKEEFVFTNQNSGVTVSVDNPQQDVAYDWYQEDGTTLVATDKPTILIGILAATTTYKVVARYEGCSSKFATITVYLTDANPISAGGLSLTTTTCGYHYLNLSGVPPTNVEWYWQYQNPNGTDMAIRADRYDLRILQEGTYWVRPYDRANQVWGSQSTSFVVSFAAPTRNTPVDCADIDEMYVADPPQYTNLAPYSSVSSYTAFKGGLSASQIRSETDNNNVNLSSQYVDGLGRPLQQVTRGASANGTDLIQLMHYDPFGREARQYLPYADSSGNDGSLKTDPFNDQASFYGDPVIGQFKEAEDAFYGLITFERSPLNRPRIAMAAGDAWAGSSTGVRSDFSNGTTSDDIRLWEIDAGGLPITTSSYAEGEISVSLSTDEEGNQMKEYIDKTGQVVLKKVQDASNPGDGHGDWLNTYYVYDDYGQLVYVLPPKAVALLETASWNWSSTNVSELVFTYTYDTRGRMITKQVPGAGAVQMLYDKLDRLVLTQDANQAALSTPQWTFTKYDGQGRPVMTGFLNTTDSRNTLESIIDSWDKEWTVERAVPDANGVVEGATIFLSSHIPGTSMYHAVTEIQFLDGFDTDEEFETEIGGTLTSSDYSIFMGYKDATFPLMANGNLEVLTVNYYDDYRFTTTTFDDTVNPGWTAAGTDNAELVSTTHQTQGLATGSMVKILDSNDDWLSSVMFYDQRGRVVQTYTQNHKGGADITTSQYDFSGKVLKTYLLHENPEAEGSGSMAVFKKFEYDHASRLLSIDVDVNNTGFKRLVTNEYDHLGELKTKKLGDLGAELETLDYEYNIRGWLESINGDYVANGGTSNYFGMELSYDHGFAQNQMNGNIAGVTWRSQSFDKAKAYGFDYDGSNRLSKADFSQQEGAAWNHTLADFSTTYGYDQNGNIENLKRWGMLAGGITEIDDLVYHYLPNSNQLSYVTDTKGDMGQGDFRGGTETTIDYRYDANGNMTQDQNKGIQEGDIEYNHLNLPTKITFDDAPNKTITYTYDAAGIKLRKTVNDEGTVTTTDYVGGYIYENDALQFFGHEEGRTRLSDGQFVYDYFVKDHLGNTRVTLTEEVVETTYQATMESEAELSTYEEQLFLNIATLREVSAAANKTATAGNVNGNEAVRLNGIDANRQLGPAKMLQVMADDEVDIEVYAHYTGSPASHSPIADAAFATLIGNAFGGNSAGTAGEQQLQSAFENGANLQYVVPSSQETNNTSIKAYLNYVLFNSDFELVTSGFKRVDQVAADANGHRLLQFLGVSIEESGYLYVYVSNEGDIDFNVFFDEFEIRHTKGAILQEDHYYPFGMNIQALSSSAPLSKPNQFKFNGGTEFNASFDLNTYETSFRGYDPQLGRFMQIDPLADFMPSVNPYQFGFNNPISLNDPFGLSPKKRKPRCRDKTCRRNRRALRIRKRANRAYLRGASTDRVERMRKRADRLTKYKKWTHRNPRKKKGLPKISDDWNFEFTPPSPTNIELLRVPDPKVFPIDNDQKPTSLATPPPVKLGQVFPTGVIYEDNPPVLDDELVIHGKIFNRGASTFINRSHLMSKLSPLVDIMLSNPTLKIEVIVRTPVTIGRRNRFSNTNRRISDVMNERVAAIVETLRDLGISSTRIRSGDPIGNANVRSVTISSIK